MTIKQKRLLTVLLVLVLVFIWGNSLTSREFSGWVSDTIMEYMNRGAEVLGLREDLFTDMRDTNNDGVEEPTSHLIRKAAHIIEFAVLGSLLWLRLESVGWRRFFLALAGGTLAGGVDETLQIFSHRGHQLSDVGVDALGALLGIIVTAGVVALLRRRKDAATHR